ncbi:ketoacyl-synt domain-containing protein/Ketoacyl-synt_C domain-containing protein [Cephalotus follicularis]|uniref:3-oxoacyl-[acyl-carrier-protein] synthase, mitochondrial n=1 Tax=Cephalotus follicularis TaxID=3775 RepID=A0A1Q3B338_CEPFO|nr:ketoacyl-synt domain-containing protein/Ketoacyl-synt_C domain-containing protein [Cephalotus follicularis]
MKCTVHCIYLIIIRHANAFAATPIELRILLLETGTQMFSSRAPVLKASCAFVVEPAMANLCYWRKLIGRRRFQFTRCISSASRFDHSLRRVVVTGLGMVTPLGCGVDTTWKRLLEGKCGIRETTPEDLKMNSFDRETQLHAFDQLTSKVAAIVPCGTNPGEFDDQFWLNSKEHRSIARFISYALCAADEALNDAKWLPSDQEEKERTGVSIGAGTGSISDILDAAQMICEKRLRRLSPYFIPRILINMPSGHVSMKYGFQGPNHAAVTACATGAHSIGDATRMIQFGDADVMVAGGTESSIDALSIAGFCRSRALTTKYNSAPLEASRPFDCGRDGFVIGEGSGVMVLEEFEHAKERGAKIYAEVRGYGMSGDAYHITQPHTNGRGAILAMTRALKQAGIHPNQVDYVNAHATSTPLGDSIEANAIKTVFSEHATLGDLAFSSTKGAIGHLLGAAGAVEAIFAVLSIRSGIAPLTLNLTKPDPVFNDNFMPLTASKEMPVKAALSNSFGFGGTNASLLFCAAP